MTEIEAIKVFNTILIFGKCDLPADEAEETIKITINALERQLPKKPIDKIETIPVFDEDGDCIDVDTRIHLFCPICGKQVGIDDCIDTYCDCCGQRIDFSE